MTLPRGLAAWSIGLLALLIVIAGFYVTGGPSDARKERRDNQRQRDLHDMAQLIECLAQENGNRLPETVQPTQTCESRGPLTDPQTGKPYRYEVLGPRSYRICANHEAPARRTGAAREDCVIRRHALPSMPGTSAPRWQ